VASDKTGPRRAPEPEDRRRDAERTRRALLDAALVEFADKGRAGARVSEIAARAGVNKQLISYYFGGKDGLYDAIVERWHKQEESWSTEDLTLADLAARYLEASVDQHDLQRAFIRDLLDEGLEGESRRSPGVEPEELEDMRRRQAAGEIAPDLDPALVLVLLQGAVSAGLLFGADVRDLAGLDPRSREFLDRYGALLRRVVAGLADPA
jgi:AcrR family transcriptional regulator